MHQTLSFLPPWVRRPPLTARRLPRLRLRNHRAGAAGESKELIGVLVGPDEKKKLDGFYTVSVAVLVSVVSSGILQRCYSLAVETGEPVFGSSLGLFVALPPRCNWGYVVTNFPLSLVNLLRVAMIIKRECCGFRGRASWSHSACEVKHVHRCSETCILQN